MARKTTRKRTSKAARRKVRGFVLRVDLPPETTKEQVDRLKTLLGGAAAQGARVVDLFKADVIASTGMKPESPIACNDVERPPEPRPPAPRPRRR